MNINKKGYVIKLSGAISPYEQREKQVDFGGGAIPVSLAQVLQPFLKEDLTIGIKYSLQKSPREILEDAIKNKEWFKGIVLSTAFFEHFSSAILFKRTNGGINNDKLKLRLERLVRLLLDFDLVSTSIHSKMQEIAHERNALVHNPFEEIDEETATRLIKNAIEILVSLGVADIS